MTTTGRDAAGGAPSNVVDAPPSVG
jgi:hypothetical protein